MIDVLDVSRAQGAIDWPRVVAHPVAPGVDRRWRAAIVKVTEGPRGRDPKRLEYLAGARAVGMRTGVYHYLYPNDELKSAADASALALRVWDAVGDELPHFRVAIDLEGADAWLTPQQLLDRVLWCRDGVAEYFGRAPMLYTYPWFYEHRLKSAFATSRDLAETVPLWWARYSTGTRYPTSADVPKAPAPWDRVTLWQYSGNDGARVPGFGWAVDRNLFLGDEDAFVDFCGLTGSHGEADAPIVRPAVPFAPRRVRVPGDDEPPPTAA